MAELETAGAKIKGGKLLTIIYHLFNWWTMGHVSNCLVGINQWKQRLMNTLHNFRT